LREIIVHLSPSLVRFSAICRHIPRRGSTYVDYFLLSSRLLSSRLLLFTSKTSLICSQSASVVECSSF
jgi:hypothetical protein